MFIKPNILKLIFIFILINPHFVFSQVSPYIKVISPNGGENWEANSTQIIRFESKGVDKIKIEYSLSGGLSGRLLVSSVDASSGEYLWTIPDAISNYGRIRISDASNPSIVDMSDNNFNIVKTNIAKTSQNQISKLNKTTTADVTQVKIMPLGDSITYGVIPSWNPDNPIEVGYRGPLFSSLTTTTGSIYSVDFVGSQQNVSGTIPDPGREHEGHPGWFAGPPSYPDNQAQDMTYHLNTYLNTYHPDVVLLHIGTNDISIPSNQIWYKTNLGVANAIRGLMNIIYNYNVNTKIIVARIINRTGVQSYKDRTTQINLLNTK